MDELEIFKPRSLFEGGTVSSGKEASSLNFEAMIKAVNELEERLAYAPRIESILITAYCPNGYIMKMRFEGLLYFLISPSLAEKLKAMAEPADSALSYITGIPLVEDDALVKRLIEKAFDQPTLQNYLNPRMG